MKKHLPRSCSEWLRLLIGGAAAGLVYLAVALPTGLSGAVSRIELPVIGSLCGVLCGCIFLVVNALLLEATVRRIASGRSGPGLYRLSYAGRYLLAGVVLAVGFAFFDPFAVFVVLVSPKITYLVCALAGIGMES